MTSNWTLCKLSDIAEYINQKICVENLDNTTYISTENMLPNKSGITKAATLPNIKLTPSFRLNDVLISNIRPYFRKIWMAVFEGGCSNDVLVIRAKENIDSKFLYYVLSDDKFFDYATATAKGTKMPRGDKTSIMKYQVPKFDLVTQQKIAKILSAIDDKIELNNKINANLEEQAQCYFSSTISESKNVQYVSIGNICDVKGGKRLPKGINLITTPNSHPYIRVRDLNNTCVAQLNNSYEFVDNETQKLISRYTVNSQDVVISIVGTIGLTAIIGNSLNNANLTENCVKLTNLKQITPEFLLLFLRSKTGQDIINKSTVGAVQAKLPIKNIQAIQIPLISDNSLNDYLRAIFKNIANNLLENEKLIQLRDTLLPKFMNGEINVEKIQP